MNGKHPYIGKDLAPAAREPTGMITLRDWWIELRYQLALRKRRRLSAVLGQMIERDSPPGNRAFYQTLAEWRKAIAKTDRLALRRNPLTARQWAKILSGE